MVTVKPVKRAYNISLNGMNPAVKNEQSGHMTFNWMYGKEGRRQITNSMAFVRGAYYLDKVNYVLNVSENASGGFNAQVSHFIINMDMMNNLQKLDEISKYDQNWNGYDAAPFANTVIERAKSIIIHLDIQPELFPTAAGSIQIEYENLCGDYLEIQITEEDSCQVFMVNNEGEAKSFQIQSNPEDVNRMVIGFYG